MDPLTLRSLLEELLIPWADTHKAKSMAERGPSRVQVSVPERDDIVVSEDRSQIPRGRNGDLLITFGGQGRIQNKNQQTGSYFQAGVTKGAGEQHAL